MEIEAMDYIDWDEGREPADEPEEAPEQCDCYFDGDMADASECGLHGGEAR